MMILVSSTTHKILYHLNRHLICFHSTYFEKLFNDNRLFIKKSIICCSTLAQNKSILKLRKQDIRENQLFQLMRLDKPAGSYLLWWPSAWGITLASPTGTFPDVYLLTLFGIGTLLMRSGGCIINDFCDRSLDQKVARCANRPFACNSVNAWDALATLSALLGIAVQILLQFNWCTILLGVGAMGFVMLYPLMKRITFWPQAVLGFTFNWGILMGYSAVQGYCDFHICFPFYIAAIFWTLIYDTIYALQDWQDDVKAGIKSTAILFGEKSNIWLTGFSFCMVSTLVLAGIIAHLAWPYYLSVGLTACQLMQQVCTLDVFDIEACGRKFRQHSWIGFILFVGILFGNLLRDSRITN